MERLSRGTSNAGHYDEAIRALQTDLIVVTEPGSGFIDRYPEALCSPPQRPSSHGAESWIALVGQDLEATTLELPYNRLAVAAQTVILGQPVAIYGSVLPWNAARSQAPDVYGEEEIPLEELFRRAITAQVADVKSLQNHFGIHNVFWAGDFNHPLVGPLSGFSKAARELIADSLESLGMRAFNQEAANSSSGACTIDLICGSVEHDVVNSETLAPRLGDKPLSDHNAYVIDVRWPLA